MRGKLRSIQNRIKTVGETQKVTNVMRMISSSKFRTFHELLNNAMFYDKAISAIVNRYFVSRDFMTKTDSIFLRPADAVKKNELLICIASDKSLCGSFNDLVEGAVEGFIKQRDSSQLQIMVIGAKLKKYIAKNFAQLRCVAYDRVGSRGLHYDYATKLFEQPMNSFLSGDLSSVHIIFTRFINSIKRQVSCEQLLPIIPASVSEADPGDIEDFESDLSSDVDGLFAAAVRSHFYVDLLHSNASEHCARMMTMDNAVRSAKKISNDLNLMHNRMRQAGITTELIEVISGAEAIKKE